MSDRNYNILHYKASSGGDVLLMPRFSLRGTKDEKGNNAFVPRIDMVSTHEYGPSGLIEHSLIPITADMDAPVSGKNICLVDPAANETFLGFHQFDVEEFIGENGIGTRIGTHVHDGVEYPIYKFDEDFLREIGGVSYEIYEASVLKQMDDGQHKTGYQKEVAPIVRAYNMKEYKGTIIEDEFEYADGVYAGIDKVVEFFENPTPLTKGIHPALKYQRCLDSISNLKGLFFDYGKYIVRSEADIDKVGQSLLDMAQCITSGGRCYDEDGNQIVTYKDVETVGMFFNADGLSGLEGLQRMVRLKQQENSLDLENRLVYSLSEGLKGNTMAFGFSTNDLGPGYKEPEDKALIPFEDALSIYEYTGGCHHYDHKVRAHQVGEYVKSEMMKEAQKVWSDQSISGGERADKLVDLYNKALRFGGDSGHLGDSFRIFRPQHRSLDSRLYSQDAGYRAFKGAGGGEAGKDAMVEALKGLGMGDKVLDKGSSAPRQPKDSYLADMETYDKEGDYDYE